MAKIFISFFNGIIDEANPSAMPPFYETFINGLVNSGNEVLAHPVYQWYGVEPHCPRDLLIRIQNFEPDLMIFFNNHFYDVSNKFDCPIVIYEVDSILHYYNKKALKQNQNRYHYIVSQTDSIETLQKELGITKDRIGYLPFFTQMRAEKIPQTTNISFIGSKFGTLNDIFPVVEFMARTPSEDEIKQFKE